MSTLGTSNLTLADIAKRRDPNDKIARIIELLTQQNDAIDDIRWKETNETSTELTTVRTALPTVYWRLLNAGTQASKSTTAQIKEGVGMLDAWSTVDKVLADLGGDSGGVRLSEARAFLEAMRQEFMSTMFYGTAAAPEEFIGLSARYSALTGAGNSNNIIDASSSNSGGDYTSIWLIAWDTETLCGIFPQGIPAGLRHEDKGVQTLQNAGGVTGALQDVYMDHFMWNAGIAVKDYRYAVRIANIDVSNLAGGSAADLIDAMEQAEEVIPNELGNRAFYMNRRVRRFLRKQYRTDVTSGGGLTYENVSGKRVTMFGMTPVRTTDALVNTEATVS